MINKIKSRKDFINIQRNGKKIVSSSLIVQNLKNSDEKNLSRFGFTASKKVGGAVLRNKAKRRMRSLVNDIKILFKPCGQDYVLIARKEIIYKEFSEIKNELIQITKNLSS